MLKRANFAMCSQNWLVLCHSRSLVNLILASWFILLVRPASSCSFLTKKMFVRNPNDFYSSALPP